MNKLIFITSNGWTPFMSVIRNIESQALNQVGIKAVTDLEFQIRSKVNDLMWVGRVLVENEEAVYDG